MNPNPPFPLSVDASPRPSSQGIRGRYAPSPSGPLHQGNARTALLAWLQARLRGGVFVLRMEDLDQPRVKPGSAAQILDDLRWLGLDWDEGPDSDGCFGSYVQSARTDFYERAFKQLQDRGLVYPCFCSRKDIVEAASAPHRQGRTHIYPGTCASLSPASDAPDGKKNKPPAWRYRVPAGVITFEDQICGPFSQNLEKDVGDFVIRRADGLFSYQLAVVADDMLMAISDVVRGADLLDSTPRQLELFRIFGHTPPRFWHVPLMMDASGKRMAKRDGSASIAQFREQGGQAESLIGKLAESLGLVPSGLVLSAQALLVRLDFHRFQEALRAGGE